MPLSRLQNIYTPLLHVTITKRVVEFGERSVPSHNIYTGCGRRKGKDAMGSGQVSALQVQHAFREANRVADAMVKLVGVMQDHFVVWDIPPSNVIANFVYFDTNGENVCRLAASNLAILA